VNKSVSMRMGPRYLRPCAPLVLSGQAMQVVDRVKYLGVYFKAAARFKIDFKHTCMSFYRAFNCIFSKSKAANSESASVFLLTSGCIPIITYALEAAGPAAGDLKMLDGLIDNAFRKIFNIARAEDIDLMRSVFDVSKLIDVHRIRICRFLLKFSVKPLSFSSVIFYLAFGELKPLLLNYDICLGLIARSQVSVLLRRLPGYRHV